MFGFHSLLGLEWCCYDAAVACVLDSFLVQYQMCGDLFGPYLDVATGVDVVLLCILGIRSYEGDG